MIATGINASAAIARSQPPPSSRMAPSSFSAALTTATAKAGQAERGSEQVDFTSMTRQALFDWMNDKIKSGEMSLHESTPFLGMTLKIAVNAKPGDAVPLDDHERVDFLQMAQDGIAGARSRNDARALEMLQSALQIMQSGRAARTRFG